MAIGDTGPQPPPGDTNAERAVASIEPEDGQWAVYLTVIFSDGVVRRRIAQYHTLKRAEIAAKLYERSADRNLGGYQP